MKARAFAAFGAAALALAAQSWQVAKPGYKYEFPRDHFSHPNFQTEWWYYTGNVRAADGHRFGFELTFFRQGQHVTAEQVADSAAVWRPDQIYVAHLALSDIDGKQFFHTQRLNRAGPELAGAGLTDRKYWNGNWQSKWISLASGQQELQAVTEKLKLRLQLTPEKPFVINGENGVSRKGPLPGEASHYITCTRLAAGGKLTWNGRNYDAKGVAWMDHEFFTESADNELAGWDWFAIQLDNRRELMLYRLRSKSGSDRFSSGTFVDADGKSRYLNASQFHITPVKTWHSTNSGATYPISWKITVPPLGFEMTEETALENQELFDRDKLTPTYWEGAVTYSGFMQGTPARGVGYLEMTGYGGRTSPLAAP